MAAMTSGANTITHLMQRWRLSKAEVATLICSHPRRVSRILRYEVPEFIAGELERLAQLLDIDRLYESLSRPTPFADWLRRGGAAEDGLRACPLEQLKADAAVIVRMRDALQLLSDGEAAVDLDAGLDAILDHLAQSSE
jgi:hypothetical protein